MSKATQDSEYVEGFRDDGVQWGFCVQWFTKDEI